MKGHCLKTLGLVALFLGYVTSTFADIQFRDVLGRDVHLKKPAESIFLGFYFEDYLAIVGPDAYKKVAIFPTLM